MLTLNAIDLALGAEGPFKRPILKNVHLDVRPGEFVVVIGSNGAGKSTLFDVIAGNRMPDKGTVCLNGQDLAKVTPAMRAALIAKVVQDPKVGTMENLSIAENLSFAYLRGQRRGLKPHSRASRRQWFRDKLAILNMNLENRLDEPVSHLSGGQRQALALVMATISPSQLLLLDEITAALDPNMAETVMQMAATVVAEEQKTALMITHNMAHALTYGDRTVLLAEGTVRKVFTATEKKQLTPALLTSACW